METYNVLTSAELRF